MGVKDGTHVGIAKYAKKTCDFLMVFELRTDCVVVNETAFVFIAGLLLKIVEVFDNFRVKITTDYSMPRESLVDFMMVVKRRKEEDLVFQVSVYNVIKSGRFSAAAGSYHYDAEAVFVRKFKTKRFIWNVYVVH